MRNKKLVLIVLMAMSTRDVQAAMPNEKQAAALAWSMRYDEADRITSITDPAGRKTAIAYNVDERNRLRTVTRTHTDETKVTWSIDQFGRRAGMTDVAAGGPLCIRGRERHPFVAAACAVEFEARRCYAWYDCYATVNSFCTGWKSCEN